MTGVTRDVTEIRAVESARKRAERALRDREQMLSGVIDKTRDLQAELERSFDSTRIVLAGDLSPSAPVVD